MRLLNDNYIVKRGRKPFIGCKGLIGFVNFFSRFEVRGPF